MARSGYSGLRTVAQKAAQLKASKASAAKRKMAGNKKLTMAKYVGTKNGDYTEINAHTFAGITNRNRKLANKIAGSNNKSGSKRLYSRRSIGEE